MLSDRISQEVRDHRSFGSSRTRCFIGRQEYLDRLDAYLAAPVGSPDDKPIVLLAESGMGKSAIIANWLASVRARQRNSKFPGAAYTGGYRVDAPGAASARSADAAKALKAEAAGGVGRSAAAAAAANAAAEGKSGAGAGAGAGHKRSNSSAMVASGGNSIGSVTDGAGVLHLNIALVQDRFIGSTSDSTLASTLLLWVLEELNSALGPFYIDGELAVVPNSAQELYEMWPLFLQVCA